MFHPANVAGGTERFLMPWESVKRDIQDMKQFSASGNQYLLVAVDRATRFLFTCSLPSKSSEPLAMFLVELFFMFGITLLKRSDAGGEFISEVFGHLHRWMRIQLNHRPACHARSLGAIERNGGWLHVIFRQ